MNIAADTERKSAAASPGLRQSLLTLLIASVGAAWIIPARLYFGFGSRYMFGYLPDEVWYITRLQPLVGGATIANPVNGFGDPRIWSPHYLENACRSFLVMTGIDPVTFAWTWRLSMPVLLIAAFLLIARAALPGGIRPWRKTLLLACGAAALPMLYGCYMLTGNRAEAPLLFINRMPTNIDYPLSLLTAALYLRFVQRPGLGRGILLVLGGAAMLYLRVYTFLPWAVALTGGMLWLILRKRVSFRVWMTMLLTALLAALPWILVVRHNAPLPAYQALITRTFVAYPYMVHGRWMIHVGVAALMLLLAWRCAQARVAVFSMALSLAAMPFVCGLLSISQELLVTDRFIAFYLSGLALAVLVWLGRHARAWTGSDGMRTGQRTAVLIAVLCVPGTGFQAVCAWRYDFASCVSGQTQPIAADHAYHPAYKWVATNTPADALFLVDDGFDWNDVPDDPGKLGQLLMRFQCNLDLFQLIARRRRVYMEYSHWPMTEAALQDLLIVQRGTFGDPIREDVYVKSLKKVLPQYIFWRKRPPVMVAAMPVPVPRGHGKILRKFANKVYEDDLCLIWKMDYTRVAESAP